MLQRKEPETLDVYHVDVGQGFSDVALIEVNTFQETFIVFILWYNCRKCDRAPSPYGQTGINVKIVM